MGLLTIITQACQNLTATASPSIDALGLRMVIALATIMLVWFGAQEALASATGGSGFSMARFVNLFMLLTFAYVMVAYYDGVIPGIGVSIRGFVNGGAQYLVQVIGTDSINQMQNTLQQAELPAGPGVITAIMNPYFALVYFAIQFMLWFWAATLALIVGYEAIASTIVGMFGPILIPWMVFERTSFLFWGWLRAFIGFCFYKVVAAAVLSLLGQLLTYFAAGMPTFTDPATMAAQAPLLVLLVLINVYVLFQVPHLTMAIFSGSTGGSGGGMATGIVTAVTLASRV